MLKMKAKVVFQSTGAGKGGGHSQASTEEKW